MWRRIVGLVMLAGCGSATEEAVTGLGIDAGAASDAAQAADAGQASETGAPLDAAGGGVVETCSYAAQKPARTHESCQPAGACPAHGCGAAYRYDCIDVADSGAVTPAPTAAPSGLVGCQTFIVGVEPVTCCAATACTRFERYDPTCGGAEKAYGCLADGGVPDGGLPTTCRQPNAVGSPWLYCCE